MEPVRPWWPATKTTRMKPLTRFTPGQRLGDSVVIAPVPREEGQYVYDWRLMCGCGEEFVKAQSTLCKAEKNPPRCRNCYLISKTLLKSAQKYQQGEVDGYLYGVWHRMKYRCLNRKNKHYKDYGGRGITIHQPWLIYQVFADYVRANIGDRIYPTYSLDRIDNDGSYVPGNIRWATKQEQALNRRRWAKYPPEEKPERDRIRMREYRARKSAERRTARQLAAPQRDPLI